MNITEFFPAIVFFVVSGICAVTDLTGRTIKNSILAIGTAAILTSYVYHPPAVRAGELLPLLLMAALFLIFFLFHLMGAGDVKLYAFLILAFPETKGLLILAGSVFLAGAYGCFRILQQGVFVQHVRSTLRLGRFLLDSALLGTIAPAQVDAKETIELPMAVFVFAAALAVWLIRL